MTNEQFQLARRAAKVFFVKADDGHKDLDRFLDMAAMVVANPGAYKQHLDTSGEGWKAKGDLQTFTEALKKHNRKPGKVSAITAPKPTVTSLPWIRVYTFAPRGTDKGSAEFQELYFYQGASRPNPMFGDPVGRPQPPERLCIPAQQPTDMYDGAQLVKDGDAVPITAKDGSEWIKLTPQFFAKHGYEYTTDGKQVKPNIATLRGWLKSRTSEQQREDGAIISHDGHNGIAEELLRLGLAESYSETQIKVTADNFRTLGLNSKPVVATPLNAAGDVSTSA